ncbi:IS1/IS1595 family N-terminal zinc-binding domain-containing protein [Candidatus Fukatsuia endosymbiont of Drepanosiphum platanoidis]
MKKHGIGSGGHPRFRCLSCNRTFQLDYCYKTCQSGVIRATC